MTRVKNNTKRLPLEITYFLFFTLSYFFMGHVHICLIDSFIFFSVDGFGCKFFSSAPPHVPIFFICDVFPIIFQFVTGRHADYAENIGVQVEFMGLLIMVVDRVPCKEGVSQTKYWCRETEDHHSSPAPHSLTPLKER